MPNTPDTKLPGAPSGITLQRTSVENHTPGPWAVSNSGFANAPFVIYTGTVKPDYRSKFPLGGVNAIAEVFCDESPDLPQHFANAKLIACSPDMLRLLRLFRSDFADVDGDDHDKISLKVAKFFSLASDLLQRMGVQL